MQHRAARHEVVAYRGQQITCVAYPLRSVSVTAPALATHQELSTLAPPHRELSAVSSLLSNGMSPRALRLVVALWAILTMPAFPSPHTQSRACLPLCVIRLAEQAFQFLARSVLTPVLFIAMATMLLYCRSPCQAASVQGQRQQTQAWTRGRLPRRMPATQLTRHFAILRRCVAGVRWRSLAYSSIPWLRYVLNPDGAISHHCRRGSGSASRAASGRSAEHTYGHVEAI